jgi:nitrate reductase gamma subunit
MTFADQFLWVVFPYIALTVFVVGLVWRYSSDPYGWTSKSSEVLEKRWLAWGNQLFHWGFLAVVVGHVMGLLIPPSVDASVGLTTASYHAVAFYGGSASGVVALAGLVILTLRRVGIKRVRVTSTPSDYLTLALLLGVMTLGMLDTLGYTAIVGPYDYRDTIGVWFRGLVTFAPNVAAMANVPELFQIHVLAGLVFFMLLPFTRLVHLFSLPFHYLNRRFIVFRSQQLRGARGR